MKGYIIDCDYIIQVKEYMPLPRPTRKLTDIDGSIIPIIHVETEI
jgi:hypothetical protein